jgi:hypothetical protein
MKYPERECPWCGSVYTVGDKDGYQMYSNHLETHAEGQK